MQINNKNDISLCSRFLIVKINVRCTFLFVQDGSSATLTSSRNRKTLPDLLVSGKDRNQNRLMKNTGEHTPKGNKRLRNSNKRSAKTNPAPKNQSSSKTSELPASIAVDLRKHATFLSAMVDPPKSSHQMDDLENHGRVSVKPASPESTGALSEGAEKTAEASERKSKNEISKKRNALLSRCSTASNNAR